MPLFGDRKSLDDFSSLDFEGGVQPGLQVAHDLDVRPVDTQIDDGFGDGIGYTGDDGVGAFELGGL